LHVAQSKATVCPNRPTVPSSNTRRGINPGSVKWNPQEEVRNESQSVGNASAGSASPNTALIFSVFAPGRRPTSACSAVLSFSLSASLNTISGRPQPAARSSVRQEVTPQTESNLEIETVCQSRRLPPHVICQTPIRRLWGGLSRPNRNCHRMPRRVICRTFKPEVIPVDAGEGFE